MKYYWQKSKDMLDCGYDHLKLLSSYFHFLMYLCTHTRNRNYTVNLLVFNEKISLKWFQAIFYKR